MIVDRDDFGKKTLSGLTGHMLHFVVNSMGMKYEVTFPNDHEWGSPLPNGSWTGMIGDLTRNVGYHGRKLDRNFCLDRFWFSEKCSEWMTIVLLDRQQH